MTIMIIHPGDSLIILSVMDLIIPAFFVIFQNLHERIVKRPLVVTVESEDI